MAMANIKKLNELYIFLITDWSSQTGDQNKYAVLYFYNGIQILNYSENFSFVSFLN